MKQFILSLLLILSLTSLTGEENFSSQNGMNFIPYRKKNLWGFASTSGEILIKAHYKMVSPFLGEVAPVYVEEDSKIGWLLIDKTGEKKSHLYEKIEKLDDRFFIFQERGKEEFGLIDKTGKLLTQERYTRIEPISENRILVTKGGFYGKYGFLDKKGKEIIPPKYDAARSFSEKRAVVGISIGTNPKTGKKILKFGYIGKNGKEFIEPIYNIANSFHNGLAAVAKGNKLGFIDKKGNTVIPFEYDMVDYGVGFFEKNLSIVRLDNKPLIISREGKTIVEKGLYDSIEPFREGLARVGKGNFKLKTVRFGYIDTTGKEIISCQYMSAGDFSEGLAAVSLGENQFGYIDSKGKPLTEFKYFYLEKFKNGFGIAKQKIQTDTKENKYSILETFINREGKELTDFKYKSIAPFEKFSDNYFGFVHTISEDSYIHGGYIDANGNEFFKD